MVAGAFVGMGIMQLIASCTLSMLLRHTKRIVVIGKLLYYLCIQYVLHDTGKMCMESKDISLVKIMNIKNHLNNIRRERHSMLFNGVQKDYASEVCKPP